ncbi:winged helix-turn-helix domain-containing protein [Pseudidiomarina taiwanensis]|uniref:OmpR/PhoB-type domain-containing protein n=1 Tax=Pseudidiomarina taiwanensis TaxID=337250 RepID=A0A432ZED9_9GAMM|nr:winged helix-turn-helix domain-containing protein [Pseudidiomarina taiwanensis]RUO76326.1 hypothetical protein CWI83_08145 [Pseudidiomarina taiwanensis]
MSAPIQLGDWRFESSTGVLTNAADEQVRLEPKSAALLTCLLETPEQLVSKKDLLERVWPETCPSEDTLLRTVSRLRSALGDSARAPRYIETVPKRGYRLLITPEEFNAASFSVRKVPKPLIFIGAMFAVAVTALVVLMLTVEDGRQRSDLLSQADDYYHQMRLADNERAISLYQQQLELKPDTVAAYAGLANALVQKALRYSESSPGDPSQASITEQVASGALATDANRALLQRAAVMADKALALQPNSTIALKAKGFVRSAQGDYAAAIRLYQQALEHDASVWPIWLNLAELFGASGDLTQAREAYQQGYQVMQQEYAKQPVQIRPWLASVGLRIGDSYYHAEQLSEAESWYREVLSIAPLHEQATIGLVRVLYRTGDRDGALNRCVELNQRLRTDYRCTALESL